MKRILLSLILVCAGLSLRAQLYYPSKADAAKLKPRTLIFVLMDETKGTADMKSYAAEFNAYLQELAPAIWKFNTSVLVKTGAEASEMTKQEEDKYATCEFKTCSYTVSGRTIQYSAMAITLGHPNAVRVGDDPQGQILTLALSTLYLGKLDLRFALQNANNTLLDLDAGRPLRLGGADARINKLKTLTLLIPQDAFGVPQAKLAEAYKAPYKLVPESEIIAAIENEQEGVAYITAMGSREENNMVLVTVEAKTGMVLSRSGTGGSIGGIGVGGAKRENCGNCKMLALYRNPERYGMSAPMFKTFLNKMMQEGNALNNAMRW